MRRIAGDALDPAFPFNAPINNGAAIIAARRNFGCGSSREAAVYALVDSGIRCVIAPRTAISFPPIRSITGCCRRASTRRIWKRCSAFSSAAASR